MQTLPNNRPIRSARPWPRLLVLLLALSLFVIAGAYRLFVNPQVPQGGSASFPSTGTEAPTTGSWDVLNPSGAQIANSTAANGWSVSLSGTTFTVGAPGTAAVAANYKVRHGSSVVIGPDARSSQTPQGGVTPTPLSASAPFDVVSGSVSPPPAPTGLTAVGGTSKATLTWTASSGATGYNLKRATTAGGPYATVATNVASPYVNAGLTNGAKHYFVVTATNSAGESGNSNEANATPIAVPTGVVATAGNAQVALSWSAAAGATGYKVKYGTTPGSYPTVVTSVGTSATVAGLTNGTTYYFVVTGTNTVGESDPSAQVSAKPVPPPPATPTGLTATAVSSSQINLAWTDNATNETGCLVERKQGATGTYAQVGNASANATSYQDTSGLSASTLYYYRVRATNAGGNSAYGNEASATTQATPAGPTNLGSIKTEPGRDYYVGVAGSTKAVTFRVTLTNAAQQATVVAVDTPSGLFSPGTVIIPVGASSATFTAQVANPGAEQVISVRARAGGFVQTTEIAVVQAGATPSVVADSYGQRNGNTVVLAWDAPALNNFGYYTIDCMSSSGAITNVGVVDAPVFADQSSPAGTTYRVTTVNFVDGSTVSTGWISPAAAASSPSVTLNGVPNGTVSGVVSITAALSGSVGESHVLVDGAENVAVLGPVRQGNVIKGYAVTLDADALPTNGTHAIQAIISINGDWAVSPVYSVTSGIGNVVETITPDPIVEDQVGSYAGMMFRVGLSGWQSYGAVLTNEDGTTIRTWSGSPNAVGDTSFVSLGWDGIDANGVLTDSGNYELTFTAQTASGNSAKKVVPISHLRGFPNLLALIQPVDEVSSSGVRNPFDDNLTRTLARRMKKYLNIVRSYPGNEYYDGLIYVLTTPGKPVTPVLQRNFLRYLRTATTFYYYGHSLAGPGSSPTLPSDMDQYYIQYGNLAHFPHARWTKPGPVSGACYAIDRCVSDYGHAYNLVFLDSCFTGGGGQYDSSGNALNVIGPVRDYWLFAWNTNAYLGWNGVSGSNSYTDGTPSRWFNWRDRFWMRVLRDGDWVSRAINYANLAPGNIDNPDPSYTFGGSTPKLTFSGNDTTLP